MKYEIKDNFLPQENLNILKKEIFSSYFPWYFQEKINIHHKNNQKDLSYYMTHNVFLDNTPSGYWNLFTKNLLFFIPHNEVIRVVVNLYPRSEKININELHVDYPYEHKSALFSLNTCDGFTSFENKKIDSKENRILFFEGHKKHSSSTCTNTKARFNININYK
tara:strand:+ start:4561 stop:5052 length:492 start_codon:yes stop_codon:yes gene_type:complete